MIIGHNQYHVTPNIEVRLFHAGFSNNPFLVEVADGVVIHMSLQDVQALQLQLTAAMYEYDHEYEYKYEYKVDES